MESLSVSAGADNVTLTSMTSDSDHQDIPDSPNKKSVKIKPLSEYSDLKINILNCDYDPDNSKFIIIKLPKISESLEEHKIIETFEKYGKITANSFYELGRTIYIKISVENKKEILQKLNKELNGKSLKGIKINVQTVTESEDQHSILKIKRATIGKKNFFDFVKELETQFKIVESDKLEMKITAKNIAEALKILEKYNGTIFKGNQHGPLPIKMTIVDQDVFYQKSKKTLRRENRKKARKEMKQQQNIPRFPRDSGENSGSSSTNINLNLKLLFYLGEFQDHVQINREMFKEKEFTFDEIEINEDGKFFIANLDSMKMYKKGLFWNGMEFFGNKIGIYKPEIIPLNYLANRNITRNFIKVESELINWKTSRIIIRKIPESWTTGNVKQFFEAFAKIYLVEKITKRNYCLHCESEEDVERLTQIYNNFLLIENESGNPRASLSLVKFEKGMIRKEVSVLEKRRKLEMKNIPFSMDAYEIKEILIKYGILLQIEIIRRNSTANIIIVLNEPGKIIQKLNTSEIKLQCGNILTRVIDLDFDEFQNNNKSKKRKKLEMKSKPQNSQRKPEIKRTKIGKDYFNTNFQFQNPFLNNANNYQNVNFNYQNQTPNLFCTSYPIQNIAANENSQIGGLNGSISESFPINNYPNFAPDNHNNNNDDEDEDLFVRRDGKQYSLK